MNKQHLLVIANAMKVMMKPIFIFTILVFVLTACGGDSDEPQPQPDPDPKPPITDIVPLEGMNLYGLISDETGKPIKDVVVSDGFTSVKTDDKGVYQMKKNTSSKFVFYSVPSDYAVNTASTTISMASFYKKLSAYEKRYDFELKKSAKETDFTFVCIGDPQVRTAEIVTRFDQEVMSDLKKTVSANSKPIYGLVMGDLVDDKPDLMSQIRRQLGSSSMPVYTTIGNHDKVAEADKNKPRNADLFMESFGPLNYSFNRGDVHFICLDNVVFSNSSTYTAGFSKEQVEWMKQDLSYVPKDKMIILYYHIPLRDTSRENRNQILDLLSEYKEVHLMCGHTHYNENYILKSPKPYYEHIHAAACGAFWHSIINGDGTPLGYAVYQVSGNKLTNWHYKSANYDVNHQMRLFRGNAFFGSEGKYFGYNKGENTILANIWNADAGWKVEIYEDGAKAGDMTLLPTITAGDAWAVGYHVGVVGRNIDNYSQPQKHMYSHTLVNPQAKTIKVVATDRFGNTYTEEKITTTLDAAHTYIK